MPLFDGLMPDEFLRELEKLLLENKRSPLPSFPVTGNPKSVVRIPRKDNCVCPDCDREARQGWVNIEVHYISVLPKKEPSSPFSQQCRSCTFFCGQTYNGNTLVCAVHPGGPDGECSDWEVADTTANGL